MKIPGKILKNSGKCLKRFRGMFNKIPGNFHQGSGKFSGRFRETLLRISKNAIKVSG